MQVSITKCLRICCAVSMLLVAGCLPYSYLITPVRTKPKLVETTLESEGWFAPKIALIDVDGILVNARTSALLTEGEHPVSLLLEKLDQARDDDAVKAVILRINSPGGTVVASELMHDEVRRFRETTGKPVVAVMMDVAASGGYYVACACDELVAHQSTVAGGIGVILQLFEVTGTMAKLGVTSHTIKSGDLKGGGSPFERLSGQDRAIFQEIIDRMHGQFVEVVAAGRLNLSTEQVHRLADGRVFSADQALEAGLIDRIATIRETVDVLKERIHAPRVRLVTYHRRTGYAPNYYARSNAPPLSPGGVNIVQIQMPSWLRGHNARFMYLWAP